MHMKYWKFGHKSLKVLLNRGDSKESGKHVYYPSLEYKNQSIQTFKAFLLRFPRLSFFAALLVACWLLPIGAVQAAPEQEKPVLKITADDEDQAPGPYALATYIGEAGAEADKLSLRDSVNRALEVHPEIHAASADLNRALTEIKMAQSGYFPSLQMSAGPENLFRGGMGYDITLSQMLFDWGRVESQVDSAIAAQRKQAEVVLGKRSDVSLDVVEVFFDLAVAERQMDIASSYRGYLQSLYQLAEDRVSAGYSDVSETSRVQQALGYAEEQIAINRGKLSDARSQLRLLLSLPMQDIQVYLPPHPDFIDKLNNEDVLSMLITRSPSFRQAEEEIVMAQANLDNARAVQKPRLQLEATSQRREIGGIMTEDSILALRFRLEPMQGLSAFQKEAAEEQRVESARWGVDGVRREMERQFNSLRENELALSARLQALAMQTANADAVRATYQEQFLAGIRDIEDLIRSERESFDAERQRTNTLSEYWRIPYRAAARLGLLGHLLEGRLEEAMRP